MKKFYKLLAKYFAKKSGIIIGDFTLKTPELIILIKDFEISETTYGKYNHGVVIWNRIITDDEKKLLKNNLK